MNRLHEATETLIDYWKEVPRVYISVEQLTKLKSSRRTSFKPNDMIRLHEGSEKVKEEFTRVPGI